MNDDLAAQEALARDFQPDLSVRFPLLGCSRTSQLTAEVQGPLVGDKKSSLAITEEYARADPIYVAKTAVGSLSIATDRPSANSIPGSASKVLAFSTDKGRWELWMAG